jgi:hypothetical protein
MEVSGSLHAPAFYLGGGPQNRPEHCGEEKNFFVSTGNRIPAVQPVARDYTY